MHFYSVFMSLSCLKVLLNTPAGYIGPQITALGVFSTVFLVT